MLVKYLGKDPNNNKKNMTWRVAMDPKQGWEVATINILGMNGDHDETKVVMEFENYPPSTTI